MDNAISVGELRQNPTPMLRKVRAGATYTITDHGEPVAEIAAHQQTRWVPGSALDALLRELGSDERWAREMTADRTAQDITDPWERLE